MTPSEYVSKTYPSPQREYYLREQLKAIRRELGEDDVRGQETRELEIKRHNEERACQSLRESLEQEKMKRQEQFVRR